MDNFSYGRNQPKGVEFGKPPEPETPLDAERFMLLLDNFIRSIQARGPATARDELNHAVEEIFRRLDGV